MIHHRLSFALTMAITLLALSAGRPAATTAAEPDWDVPNGRHFTQAGGFDVLDADSARFWSEFQRLGGVERLGYPVSKPFTFKGFATQAFQKLVLQWRPEQGRALFLNVFDELAAAGKDDWLFTVRSTPRPLQLDEKGKGWDEIAVGRLALLEANPAIRDAYNAAPNPIEDYGLPTSRVEDLGPLYSLRTQRVALQQWKMDTAWSRAGQVVVANGGDLAKEAGLFPPEVTKFEQLAAYPPVLDLINRYRAAAGAPPANINPSLERAATSHVAYYDANRGDPALAGMGLHKETPGKPGFFAATMGERAKVAGYQGGPVTENAGGGGLKSAIEWYMGTINHRLPLIHPSALDIGYAESDSSRFTIIDVGLRSDRLAVPLPSVYPGVGATGVPTSWDGAETPDPAPGIARPLGYPITVAFGIYQKVEWKSLVLIGPDGQPLPSSVARTDWMRAAAIIPHQPLQPGQRYTARVEAVVDGKPLVKEWSFTTLPGQR